MMKSVDKLRGWAKRYGPMGSHDPLMLTDEIEREIAERYVELPVDADGVPIHLGDLLFRSNGDMHYCHGIGKPSLNVMDEHLTWWRSECFHHTKPRTVEDVLRDFQQDTLTSQGEYSGEVIDADEWKRQLERDVREYADELRELMEVDA